MKEFFHFELDNGIRVTHKQVDTEVSHCGITIGAGTRDELDHEHGMAHFIEHSIFKGTKKRKAFHILNRLDSVGGELNAYTTKEKTCIYASFLNEYFDRALELLQDITFHSTFPKHELEKEKEVVIDEINSYLDSPAEQIFDDFESLVFDGHPIGRDILGTPESIVQFESSDLQEFTKRNYTTDQIIFSSVGNISVNKLKRLLKKYLEPIPTSNHLVKTPFKPNGRKKLQQDRGTWQTHCILGNLAYSVKDKNRRPLILLNNILGGPAMNTRLGLNIREKYGFAYNIESNYTAYSDTGVFMIYFGTDPKHYEKTKSLVWKELEKLKNQKLGTTQLNLAKKQLKGQVALARENNSNLMLGYAGSLLLYNRIDTYETVIRKIEAISAEQLLEVANEVFDESKMSELVFNGK